MPSAVSAHRRQVDAMPPGLADHPDYEVIKELGRGGMGVVYLAHNRLMGRHEVLKVMGQHIMERPGLLARFLAEIRAVARLQHPNIVTAYSAFRLGESIVFAMEYVEGLDLARLVKAKGPLPVANACYFVSQAAQGMQHAHEQGMVHRDIKPGNLMLSNEGEPATVKVLDFGLAKATREAPGRRWPDEPRPGSRNARLHGPGTDSRRPEGRHPGRHLQPGVHALLPVERRTSVPRREPLGPLPGAPLDGRQAAELGATGRAELSWRPWWRR